ncbi:MAG TPA: SH3 domain-containing protein, partial [Thermomicrobiales bacterium]|nr:SH3 domain-containing protein [Thermomicrobiales bacterium]
MPTIRTGRATARRLIAVCALAASLALAGAAPPALAQDAPALAAGEAAWIANAGGQNVLLRQDASFDAPVVAAYPEGTPLTVGAGPSTAADGSHWYQVAIGQASGFMDAAYLSSTWTAPPATGTLTQAQPAPASDAAPAANAAAPAPAPADAAGAQTTAATELRASPTKDGAVLGAVPAGAALTPTGEANDGFIGATYAGQTGWIDAAYVMLGEPPAAPADGSATLAQPAPATPAEPAAAPAPAAAPDAAAPLIGDPNAAPAGTAATATAVVNLRSGPSYDQPVLRVLPIGSPVVVTGDPSGNFAPVWYNGTTGWIDRQYLTTGADGAATFAQQAPAPSAATPATTTDDVVLRADHAVTAAARSAVPAGTAVETTGDPVAGFYPVTVNGLSGWISGAFLTFDGPRPGSESLDQPTNAQG